MASLPAFASRSSLLRLVSRHTCVPHTSSRTFQPPGLRTNTWNVPKYQHHLPRKTNFSRTYSTVVVQDRPRGRTRRIFTAVVLSLSSFIVGGYLALSYAPPFLTPLIMGPVPTNEDTLNWEAPDEFTRQIDEHIKNCATVQELRKNPDWIESRPHVKIPPEARQHNLTAGTLAGPDMIPVPPLIFNRKDGGAMYCFFYVGNSLSGHPGVVHGGFLATMLDEGLARCAFPVLPNKVGVTASLNINYRKPTMAGQYLVLVAETTKSEGRKAWSTGMITSLEEYEATPNGTRCKPLVEAEALFIEPRYAKFLKSLYRQSV